MDRDSNTEAGAVTEAMRILVIEDDSKARELYEDVFAAAGAEARAVETLADGLALLDEWHPHVLVCDLQLPEGCGVSAMGRVRAAGHSMPAVAVTGSSSVAERSKALAAGFSELCVKPCRPDELLAVVSRLVARSPGPHPRPLLRSEGTPARS